MSDESPPAGEDKGEPSDVKAKLAKMSGSRIRQRRAAVTRAAKERLEADSEVVDDSPPPAAPSPFKVEYKPEYEPQPKPEGAEAARAPKPAAMSAPAATPQAVAKGREPVGPAVVFVVGLLAGLAPLIATVAMNALNAKRPPGVPADAVERAHDWIHCPESAATDRWRCDVYALDGGAAGHGEFVRSPEHDATGDWRALAARGALAPHGWFETTRAKMLYARGVKISVVNTRGTR